MGLVTEGKLVWKPLVRLAWSHREKPAGQEISSLILAQGEAFFCKKRSEFAPWEKKGKEGRKEEGDSKEGEVLRHQCRSPIC